MTATDHDWPTPPITPHVEAMRQLATDLTAQQQIEDYVKEEQ